MVFAGMPEPLSAMVIELPFTAIEMTGAISASSQASSALSVSSLNTTSGHSMDVMAGLVDQLAAGAELHQPGHGERHALQLLLCRFYGGFLRFSPATFCKNRAF